MLIVDSHCHASECWFEPVENLVYEMDRNSVQQAILIQMRGQTNNRYLFECVKKYPGRFAPVALIDSESANVGATLRRIADEGASGIRLWATTRSPGSDPLMIWRAAEQLRLPVSCAGASIDFASEAFAQILQSVPQLPIVIEHLGGGMDRAPVPLDQYEKIFALARFPNVYMKLPGLGEFAKRAMPVNDTFPFERPIPPLLSMVYQAFGYRRLMWGSDFPPVSSREGYRNALRFTLHEFQSESDEARASMFGQVARSVFQVRA